VLCPPPSQTLKKLTFIGVVELFYKLRSLFFKSLIRAVSSKPKSGDNNGFRNIGMMVDHETGSSLVNEITARLDGSDCHVCCVNSIFELRRFDLVLLGVASFSFLSLLTVLLSKSVLIVDRSFYSTVADNNIVRLRQLVATKGLPVSVNPLVLDSFNRADRDVFLFGTGPSISELKPAEVDAGSVKIGCNSIVKDLSFCVEVGGFDYLCFADPVYHFGVSCYVDAFYRDLQQYLSLFPDTILVFPDFSLDFVKRRVPSRSSLLPVKIVPGFDRIVEFHKGEMTVPSNDNVLTLLMIPIASLFTGNIFFAGFDGPSVRKFGGGYSAGYYGYIWSEVLDADTVDWFKENGGLQRKNGEHFRNTLLGRGGSIDSMQMFRNFRGRDSKIEPLLKRRGLL